MSKAVPTDRRAATTKDSSDMAGSHTESPVDVVAPYRLS